MKIKCRDLDFYYDWTKWPNESLEQFKTDFQKFQQQVDLTRAPRLWLFSLGWGRGFPEKLDKTIKIEAEAANLYVLDQSQLEALMKPGK